MGHVIVIAVVEKVDSFLSDFRSDLSTLLGRDFKAHVHSYLRFVTSSAVMPHTLVGHNATTNAMSGHVEPGRANSCIGQS
jgi:hypothetical protein